jgi:mono/diheme cytochrome c family protein
VKRLAAAAILAGGLLVAACGRDDTATTTPGSASGAGAAPTSQGGAGPVGDAARGRQVWLAQCVACHNVDPGKDGTIGPAVKGASRELLEMRILHAAYPPGYTPKRDTKVMPARPDLASSLPDLTAYLR